MKTLLVERSIDCPNCGKGLNKGDIMYDDDYRGNIICGYCREDYLDLVKSEEEFIK
jgi:phage/plasmid primase-like uncharacterized protein